MQAYGFSTGALFKDAFAQGVETSRALKLQAIELSALRLRELDGLVQFLKAADLACFRYVSLHAPTHVSQAQEAVVARTLLELATRHKWHVVVHPDCMWDPEVWRPFGPWLTVENMDKRKPIGRTVDELEELFLQYPDASLCFDIGHAHQVDPSMTEAFRILRSFASRICQLHVSEVSSSSKHDLLSDAVLGSFRQVADQLPRNVPVILETPVSATEAPRELQQAARLFTDATEQQVVGA